MIQTLPKLKGPYKDGGDYCLKVYPGDKSGFCCSLRLHHIGWHEAWYLDEEFIVTWWT